MRSFNALDLCGAILLTIPWIVYWVVLTSQRELMNEKNALVTIFMVRAASLLPFFAFTIYFGLLVPGLYAG